MKINLHIERVVLEGIAIEPHEQSVLMATIETELGRLLAQNGIESDLQNGGASNAIRTSSIDIGEKDKPAHLGRHIARSVYGGINR